MFLLSTAANFYHLSGANSRKYVACAKWILHTAMQ